MLRLIELGIVTRGFSADLRPSRSQKNLTIWLVTGDKVKDDPKGSIDISYLQVNLPEWRAVEQQLRTCFAVQVG